MTRPYLYFEQAQFPFDQDVIIHYFDRMNGSPKRSMVVSLLPDYVSVFYVECEHIDVSLYGGI